MPVCHDDPGAGTASSSDSEGSELEPEFEAPAAEADPPDVEFDVDGGETLG